MRKAQAILLLIFLPCPALSQVQTTIAAPALPDLNPPANPASDASAIYCRPPQHRTDSQLMGPRVCMTNQQWSDLRAGGFEIAPDGSKVRVQKNSDMLVH